MLVAKVRGNSVIQRESLARGHVSLTAERGLVAVRGWEEREDVLMSTWVARSSVDPVCIYSDRPRIKHLRNLRFRPQFSKEFDSVSDQGKTPSTPLSIH